jgi:hypothetical protein
VYARARACPECPRLIQLEDVSRVYRRGADEGAGARPRFALDRARALRRR